MDSPGLPAAPESPAAHPTAYEKWTQSEKIPIIKGYYIPDLKEVALEDWGRKGGKGAFINLVGNEGSTDAYVCEIKPGGSLRPQRHLYEEMIYVLEGRGATTVWNQNQPQQTFEWQTDSLFAIPINTWHQHFNGRGDKPARYVAATNAPFIINLFHNLDFVFENEFTFKDRYSGEEDYFSRPGKINDAIHVKGLAPPLETNFVPDVGRASLFFIPERGGRNSSLCFELSDNTMTAHLSEFAVGSYKKAHRHGPGANIIIISGTGYSLMWPERGPRVKVPWHKGSMFVPPDRWFHQHFNIDSGPARYLALRWGSQKNVLPAVWRADEGGIFGGDQIEYRDEDPEIMKMFQEELARRKVKSAMDQITKDR